MKVANINRRFYASFAVVSALALASWACGKVYEPEVELRTFDLPAGTQLIVSPTKNLDLESLQPGFQFAGVLAEPLTDSGTIVAPVGAPVAGTTVTGKGMDDADVVGIELTSITIHGGDEARISTAPVLPQGPRDPTIGDEVTEDMNLAFVLDEPATLSWAMDPSVDDGEL